MSSEFSSSSSLPHEEISIRARRLWENAGSPADRDLEFWLEAESALRREREASAPRSTGSAGNGATEPVAKRNANRRR